jgi:hypothetical protein
MRDFHHNPISFRNYQSIKTDSETFKFKLKNIIKNNIRRDDRNLEPPYQNPKVRGSDLLSFFLFDL